MSTDFAAGPPPGSGRPLTAPLSPEDLVTLNEEIAAMARAGLPLDQGLTALAREMGRGRLQQVTQQLGADLRAGLTLPQALEKQAGRVPPYYAALLAAGVRTGRLADVLRTLTMYARTLAEFRATIAGALYYPMIILVLGVALLVIVGNTTLSVYANIFREFKMKLPQLTEIMIFVAENALTIVVLPALVLIIAFLVARWLFNASPAGRATWARLIYALPLVGTLIRSARLAAFTDLLAILVEQAVPLPEALRLAAAASSDPILAAGCLRIEEGLRQGQPLGAALHQQRLVPELVVWMIGFGEKQGTLGAALRQAAEVYRRRAEDRATLLRTILPPFLILCLAGTLGLLFIFGLMQPMMSLMEGLSGGGKK
jgi:general secretion pathway protein F